MHSYSSRERGGMPGAWQCANAAIVASTTKPSSILLGVSTRVKNARLKDVCFPRCLNKMAQRCLLSTGQCGPGSTRERRTATGPRGVLPCACAHKRPRADGLPASAPRKNWRLGYVRGAAGVWSGFRGLIGGPLIFRHDRLTRMPQQYASVASRSSAQQQVTHVEPYTGALLALLSVEP